MNPLFFILSGIILAIIAYYSYIFISIHTNLKWYNSLPSVGKITDQDNSHLHIRVEGTDDPTVLVINSIGSSQAEWWTIQDKLKDKCRVITYDRAGYGFSKESENPRTASNICDELDKLLEQEKVDKPVILVSHGSGVIYARYYAATRPEKVAKALFINPPSLDFKTWLNEANSCEDCPNLFEMTLNKSKNASKGIYRIISPIKGWNPRNNPYKRFIEEHYTSSKNHKNTQGELAEFMTIIGELEQMQFPPIPLKIMRSSIEFLIRDWVKNGMSEYSARQLGRLHEKIANDILTLSPDSSVVELDGQGENIHLENPDIVAETISEMVG